MCFSKLLNPQFILSRDTPQYTIENKVIKRNYNIMIFMLLNYTITNKKTKYKLN